MMYLIKNNDKIKINKINKLFGLMFRKKPIKEGYILYNCNAIHTFFMRQNIDIIIIDKNNKIVLIKENVKKNKIIIKKEGIHTLELPLGISENYKINDIIKIID